MFLMVGLGLDDTVVDLASDSDNAMQKLTELGGEYAAGTLENKGSYHLMRLGK